MLSQRIIKSTCKACGQPGHWAGDPECKAPRATMITAAGDDSDSVHDALSVVLMKADNAQAKEVLWNKLIKKVKGPPPMRW
eukprot:5120739-Pyramimonas_sp.AAC.1